jgi:hypothetical protein
VWTAAVGVGLCCYGVWMATTRRSIGFGPENESPWGYLSSRTKRSCGSAVAVVGVILIISALRGMPILN